MLQQETQIPVYFSYWVPEVQSILDDIKEISPSSTQKGTAAEALFSQISANGYQIVVGASHPSLRTDVILPTVFVCISTCYFLHSFLKPHHLFLKIMCLID